jgi:hypothetical protein
MPQPAISAFEAWVLSGGEVRAGLPAATMGPLTLIVDKLRATMGVAYQALGGVRREWRRLAGGGDIGDNAAKVLIVAVVGELKSAKDLLDEACREAAAAKTQSSLLSGVLDRRMQADEHEIAFQSDLARDLERQVADLNRQLREIRDSLDGAEGFGKGMAMALSFGAYNPVAEAREKAHRAIAIAEQQRVAAARARRQAEERRRELAECRKAVAGLDGLDTMVTCIANDVSEGLREAAAAYDTSMKSLERDGSSLAAIYTGLAAKRIGEVVRWAERPNPFG